MKFLRNNINSKLYYKNEEKEDYDGNETFMLIKVY